VSAKLTKRQREALQFAVDSGNSVWATDGDLVGGAFERMIDRMQSAGLVDAEGFPTPAGRSALDGGAR